MQASATTRVVRERFDQKNLDRRPRSSAAIDCVARGPGPISQRRPQRAHSVGLAGRPGTTPGANPNDTAFFQAMADGEVPLQSAEAANLGRSAPELPDRAPHGDGLTGTANLAPSLTQGTNTSSGLTPGSAPSRRDIRGGRRSNCSSRRVDMVTRPWSASPCRVVSRVCPQYSNFAVVAACCRLPSNDAGRSDRIVKARSTTIKPSLPPPQGRVAGRGAPMPSHSRSERQEWLTQQIDGTRCYARAG